MEEYYEIYEFRFVDKKTNFRCAVYARTEETAMKIIEQWNANQDIFHWTKQKFRFKKKCYTTIPPYELEQEQMKGVIKSGSNRRN